MPLTADVLLLCTPLALYGIYQWRRGEVERKREQRHHYHQPSHIRIIEREDAA